MATTERGPGNPSCPYCLQGAPCREHAAPCEVDAEARIDAPWAQHLVDECGDLAGIAPDRLELFYSPVVPFVAEGLFAADDTADKWMLDSWKSGGREQLVRHSPIPLAVFVRGRDVGVPLVVADTLEAGGTGAFLLLPTVPGRFPRVRLIIPGRAIVRLYNGMTRGWCVRCGAKVPRQVTPEIPLCSECFLRGRSACSFELEDGARG